MKPRRLLLNPTDVEGGAPAAAPAVAKAPVTNPSHAPKPPRELTSDEKKIEFKIDSKDPLFSKDTSVKSTELKSDVKDVDRATPASPVKVDDAAPVKKAPDKEAPIAPKPAVPTPAPAPEKKGSEPIVPKGVAGDKKEYDYTGFSDAEVTILKNMSVQSRDHVTKLMKENKELAKTKDGQFMQHPNAYTLDPQYSQLQEDVFYYNKETEYWQEQLAKVKNGDTWQPIKGWTKDGQPVAGEATPASAVAEEQIRLMMNRCYTATEAKQNELKQFAGNYKQRLTTDTKAINEERARRFGWVADPKILEATVEIEPGLVKTVKQVREDLISLFPPYMRNTQGVEVAADLFAALQIFGEENRALKAGKQVAEIKAEEVTRAEPTSRNSLVEGGGGRVNGVKEFSLAGLPL
jgi:hypothetical protein